MIKFAILFLLSFIPMQFVFAASFDCNKASTKVEKLICSDTEISKLDEELSKAYSGALKKSSDEQSFKSGQRDWLIERNTCSNIECLKRKYIQRTNLLKTIFGCSEKNIISELPKEVQELVPLDMGIEAIERVTEPNTDIKLIAAIADPIWSFDYCGGDMPEHDSDARVLLVWREKAGEWKQVGKSEKVLYSITTGGVSNVRLIANVDVFEVSNSQHRSGQMLWSGYDNYRFEYDLSSDSIQIINWQSSSYNYELNFFIDESQQKQYDEAKEKHGEKVSLDVGYSGEIDFSAYTGTVEISTFPNPKKNLSFTIPHTPINLDDFEGMPFYKLPYAPKSLGDLFD